MILIIHKKEYVISNDIDDIQALLDANVISQTEADLYFRAACVETQLKANFTIGVSKNGGDKEQ